MIKSRDEALLYCDGASRGNPGPSGWAYILVVDGRVHEAGGAEKLATNNQMELRALEQALIKLLECSYQGSLKAFLDSQYVLEGVKKNLSLWKRRDWKTSTDTPVKNIEIWQSIDSQLEKLKPQVQFSWLHVRGHSGNPGNDRCDEIATQFADGQLPSLFSGYEKDYPIDLNPKLAEEVRKYSSPIYLSLVDGTLYRDSSWGACEARVRGRKAKYKKVKNSVEEAEVLKAWNYSSTNTSSSK